MTAVVLTVALAALGVNGVRAHEGFGHLRTERAAPVSQRMAGVPLPVVDGPRAARTVVVRPGDTVWDLARASVPAGVALEDYVASVVVANDVDPHQLAPGTTLRLP